SIAVFFGSTATIPSVTSSVVWLHRCATTQGKRASTVLQRCRPICTALRDFTAVLSRTWAKPIDTTPAVVTIGNNRCPPGAGSDVIRRTSTMHSNQVPARYTVMDDQSARATPIRCVGGILHD